MPTEQHLRSIAVALVAVLMFGFGSPQARAQDGARAIDFNEAVRIALDQNTDLKRAANEVERQDAIIMRERMDFTPDLRFNSRASRDFGRTFSTEEGAIVNQTTDFFSVGANTSITLFNGFENFASLKRANLQGQSNELTFERTRQDVVFEVMDRYITLVRDQELIGVREEQLEAQRQQLRQVREQVDAGSRSMSEQFQQEAAVAEAEQQLLDAQRQAEVSKTRLMQTLQLDPFGNYQFVAPSVDSTDLQPEQYDLDDLLRRAFDRRTDLQAQQIELQATQQRIREARSQYFPTISAGFDYGSNWSSRAVLPSDPSPSFFDVLDNRRTGGFSLSLSIPLFDRLQRRSQVEQAQVEVQNARYALEDRRQQVALQVRQTYLDYQNARKQIQVARTRLRAAERAREAAQERYNLGAAPFVELAQAQADYVDAASQLVRARYNFIFQKKLIGYYVGVLNPREPLFR